MTGRKDLKKNEPIKKMRCKFGSSKASGYNSTPSQPSPGLGYQNNGSDTTLSEPSPPNTARIPAREILVSVVGGGVIETRASSAAQKLVGGGGGDVCE